MSTTTMWPPLEIEASGKAFYAYFKGFAAAVPNLKTLSFIRRTKFNYFVRKQNLYSAVY